MEVCQIGVVWELHKNGRAHSLEATQPEPANQPNTGKSRMLVDHRPHRTIPCTMLHASCVWYFVQREHSLAPGVPDLPALHLTNVGSELIWSG